ncbi:MAG TPA: alpha/beta hydrolase [Candidatus Wallbacteria bacterium]|nr:alpha/beta hydrolase [Candidatus Wallbacteria bacterium]
MSFVEKQVKLKNGEFDFSYREYGEGDKKILLFHGNPGSKSDFDQIAEELVKSGFCCIVPDRPGFGGNSKTPNFYNGGYIAITLYSEFIDKACGGKTYIGGYSIGAYYALKLAFTIPQKVLGLALITPYVFPKSYDVVSGIPKMAENKIMGKILNFILPIVGKGKLGKHFKDVFAPATVDAAKLADLVKNYGTAEMLFATMSDKNEFIQFPLESSRLKKIICPCVMIGAVKDEISKGLSHVEQLKKTIKEAIVENLENEGHAAIFTQAAKISEIITKNIEKKVENTEG